MRTLLRLIFAVGLLFRRGEHGVYIDRIVGCVAELLIKADGFEAAGNDDFLVTAFPNPILGSGDRQFPGSFAACKGHRDDHKLNMYGRIEPVSRAATTNPTTAF